MNRMSGRYAQSLLTIASEKDKIMPFESQLQNCITLLRDNPVIIDVLYNPANSRTIKNHFLETLFASHLEQEILNLLKLLTEKNHLKLLPSIYEELKKQNRKARKILNVTVVSAFPLDGHQIEQISEKLKEEYHAFAVEIETKIDPHIIGGIQLIIENIFTDKSIKGMIDKMKDQLMLR